MSRSNAGRKRIGTGASYLCEADRTKYYRLKAAVNNGKSITPADYERMKNLYALLELEMPAGVIVADKAARTSKKQ